MKRLLPFLFLILGIIPQSCTGKNGQRSIYKQGRSFTYDVNITKSDSATKSYTIVLDIPNQKSLNLSFKDRLALKLASGDQFAIRYQYSDSAGKSLGTPDITLGEDSKSAISLHPPRHFFMKFTEILPFPEIVVPIPSDTGSSSQVEMHIPENWNGEMQKELGGKVLKQSTALIKIESISLFGKTYDSCRVITGKNDNYIQELGQYKCTYWFNTTYGFVQLQYTKPDGTTVDMKLKKVTF